MKTFGVFVALLAASGLLAQNRSGFSGGGHGSIGSHGAVSTGRSVGGRSGHGGGYVGGYGGGGYRTGGVSVLPYAYPVAVPAYGYGYGYGYGAPLLCGNDPFCYDSTYYAGDPGAYGAGAYATAPPASYGAPAQQQPSTVIIMAPPAGAYGAPPPGQSAMMPPPPGQNGPGGVVGPASADGETGAHYYLIAFKDHSIYTAVAYWVDGETLHYFTSGNTHNQVSLSLVDRDLTRRLNEESGLQVTLPPAR